ncbi:TetR family transcriptional regulator [[Brevibacterium] flavum]|uniref:TetR family transcriptional regulator n=1 Tax=[Brevibacterium] flavum TaxID=92706 RepID=A0A0F6Z7E0_9CORY|nr:MULTISPECIES: TetR/AcrR family transcriptional regulator [Corynebacterium]AKF28841.1 TetR family transcriptional regulator [[Brevibacterium] flavum]AST22074.1 TetR family transcriptional regulator [Corynebacterium glutamicum ATCC 14067]KEI21687.1 TetR family transcriptional regulator [Corynebacterium glutamicum ATCC 14067]KIH72354.1 TetR family transcriptional regulator [Corynebacterium glutamicum]OKX95757.1 TetR family transcriptional regulator [Corynebacterium glutamicum]
MNLKDLKAAETRQRFIDVAHELFLEHGYGSTSMNQIAQAAGGSRANLYLHFRNKPDLMMAKMRELEPAVRTPVLKVFDLSEHTLESILRWLDSMTEMWKANAKVFGAMEQAMVEDAAVADEWLSMMQRLSQSVPELVENEERRVQFLASLMSMDRNFYFLYVRGQDVDEELLQLAVARQWLAVFQ